MHGDRRWAFVRGDAPGGFPWLTIRQVPQMAMFRPYLTRPAEPERSSVAVACPDGRELKVTDSQLADALAERYGAAVTLLGNKRGVFDVLPVSILTTQAVSAIAGLAGRPLDAQRFRPNVLIDAAGEEAFPEDGWVGGTLALGEGPHAARVRVDLRDKRCAVVNVDPSSARRDPDVLRTIARSRDAHLGVYGTVERPGRLIVGDPVLFKAR